MEWVPLDAPKWQIESPSSTSSIQLATVTVID